jgi:hypothetical protein
LMFHEIGEKARTAEKIEDRYLLYVPVLRKAEYTRARAQLSTQQLRRT